MSGQKPFEVPVSNTFLMAPFMLWSKLEPEHSWIDETLYILYRLFAIQVAIKAT